MSLSNEAEQPMPGAGEVEREAKRVLRKMAMQETALRAHRDGFHALMPRRRQAAKPILKVSDRMVDMFHRRGWVERDRGRPEDWILSGGGLGWIKRAMAAGDSFAAQHQERELREVMDPDGVMRQLVVNEGESPLGWLLRRRGADGKPLITRTQWEAGERLRVDFTLAQLTPRLAADLTAPVVAGRRSAKDAPLPDIVLAAKQRMVLALEAVGPGLSDMLLDVCCYLTGLEAAERAKGWPQRSAKIVLQIALDRLAAHYGLAVRGPSRANMRAWRIPDEENKTAREP